VGSLKDSSVELVLSGSSFFLETDFFLEKVSDNLKDSVERASVVKLLEEVQHVEDELSTVVGDGQQVFAGQREVAETLAQ